MVGCAVLTGTGGVGKTTLANEYARRFWPLYEQILWVDAPSGFEVGFERLFEVMFPERSWIGMTQDDKAHQVRAELAKEPARLLVIDHVEDFDSALYWAPHQPTTGCRTLITSRSSGPPFANIRSILLQVLEPGSSQQFLVARTGLTAEGEELVACHELAKILGYLPFALEQAAAYIAASHLNFAQYSRLYKSAATGLTTNL